MRSIKLDFTGEQITFSNEEVSGVENVAQTSMIILGTVKGTSELHPDKGTDLFNLAVNGNFVSGPATQTQCSFAALDVKRFMAKQTAYSHEDTLNKLELRVGYSEGVQSLRLAASVENGNLEKFGVITSI